MAQRIYIKVVGFSDEERHACSFISRGLTLERLAIDKFAKKVHVIWTSTFLSFRANRSIRIDRCAPFSTNVIYITDSLPFEVSNNSGRLGWKPVRLVFVGRFRSHSLICQLTSANQGNRPNLPLKKDRTLPTFFMSSIASGSMYESLDHGPECIKIQRLS